MNLVSTTVCSFHMARVQGSTALHHDSPIFETYYQSSFLLLCIMLPSHVRASLDTGWNEPFPFQHFWETQNTRVAQRLDSITCSLRHQVMHFFESNAWMTWPNQNVESSEIKMMFGLLPQCLTKWRAQIIRITAVQAESSFFFQEDVFSKHPFQKRS